MEVNIEETEANIREMRKRSVQEKRGYE